MISLSRFIDSMAPFLIMAELRRLAKAPSSGGTGALVVTLTVWLSTISTDSTWSKLLRQTAGPSGSSTISKVYLTSSAVKSEPSCHLTPWRSLKI